MKRGERKHEVTDLHVYRLSHDLFSITFLTAGEADHSMTMSREILDRLLQQGTQALSPLQPRAPRQ